MPEAMLIAGLALETPVGKAHPSDCKCVCVYVCMCIYVSNPNSFVKYSEGSIEQSEPERV